MLNETAAPYKMSAGEAQVLPLSVSGGDHDTYRIHAGRRDRSGKPTVSVTALMALLRLRNDPRAMAVGDGGRRAPRPLDAAIGAGGIVYPLVTFAYLAAPYLIIGVLIWAASRHFDHRGFAAVGLRHEAWIGALPWLLVGLIAAAPTWVRLLLLAPGWAADAGDALIVLVPATLIQAGAEEVLFRGILLPCLIARYGGGRGLLVSAGLFALWHIYPSQPIADMIVRGGSTFIAGLTLGIVALRQGHLGGAIALHLMWNIFVALDAGFSGPGNILGAFEGAGDILGAYIASFYVTWTFADIADGYSLRNLLLPLALETLCVMALCRPTVLKLLGGARPNREV